MVRLLTGRGAAVDAAKHDGPHPLIQAAIRGDFPVHAVIGGSAGRL